MSDEATITTLIRGWAKAVHDGDLDAVLADHADDIVMFDVPPPDDGVRGIEAYRDTWPPFFEWQRSGASFEIVDLTSPRATTSRSRTRCCAAARRTSCRAIPDAGCGSRSACARTDGRWVVAHEHHSFPARD